MRIVEQGLGYKRIEDLSESFTIWTGQSVVDTKKSTAEPLSAVRIKLVNGVEIVCGEEQTFPTRNTKKTKAVELTNSDKLLITEEVFEFDYLDKSQFKYLNRITTKQLGMLVGLLYVASPDGMIIDLPKVRKEACQEVHHLLNQMGVNWNMTEYYKRTIRYMFAINDKEFLNEIKQFLVTDKIPEIFWSSKALWRGFLKSIFTFSIIGNEMFTIRGNKDNDILKEVQQALLLFAINSSYSKGLKVSQLMIFKNNCYRFANNIGIFNLGELFSGVDFRKFLKFKDNTLEDMKYVKVDSVKKIGEQELFELDTHQWMANGIIWNK